MTRRAATSESEAGASRPNPRTAATRLPPLASLQVASAHRRAGGAGRRGPHMSHSGGERRALCSPPTSARRHSATDESSWSGGRDRARPGRRGPASPVDGAAACRGWCLPRARLRRGDRGANHRFAEIMGYEDGELDGRPVADINLGGRTRPGGADRAPDQPISSALSEARCELRNRQGRKPDLVRGARRGLRPPGPRAGLGVGAGRTTARREARTRSSSRQRRGGLGARWER